MQRTATHIDGWPRRKNGEPIFKHTEEALFYAQLIAGKEGEINRLKRWWTKAREDLRIARHESRLNYAKIMNLVVKANHYRTAMQEVRRIKVEEKSHD